MALPYTSSFDKTIGYSETCAQIHLTASVVTTYTLPGTGINKYVLTFGCSSNAQIYMGYNETPAIPAANTTTTAARVEMVIPGAQRYAIGGDVISFITPDTVEYMSISVRSIPSPRQ